ncbi:hypothetical protein [Noviherbaspirillum sp. Root189]|uniref:hypothetical protein n=1 Tax=Noviherbaspirillum sp. Root189 TaxID=1736487 RepID=UPI00070EC8C6|nr:hypothetical protein [Noviherbaspirillum sp. Root189]KRB85105.1 hypothetical protein ASE07_21305 [Noviherbaspirillum sp. Root189]
MISSIKLGTDLHPASIEALAMFAGQQHSCAQRGSLVTFTPMLAASGEFKVFDAAPAAGGSK